MAGCQSTSEPKPAALSSVAPSAKKTDAAQTAALLTQANFVKKLADTPAQKANLQALPQNQLLMRQANNGATVYVYADAAGCQCVFVGDQPAHQQYQALRAQNSAGYDQASVLPNPEVLDDWGLPAPGGAAAR
ncbi:hypothetical protein [uncultured Rhodoblastus sp.]|uniref:hypothetical protein n=1 Tax=uncultured Rhodoblastus sp. TaxID=543037 RepID=UPI0025F0483B|nr:hypothetical protein [uncultured Rhodoblastus sp.]